MAALHGPRGSALLSNIFVLLGCAALALSLSGNFLFGQRSAFTDEGQWWQGGMALFIDAMLAALALFVGILIAKKAYAGAVAMGCIACLFGAMSAYSLVGLGLSERVNKARTLEANIQQQSQVARTNYEAKIQAWNGYTDTLDASILKDKAGDKNALIAARKEAAQSVPQMVAPEIKTALTDPQAQVMAEIAKRTSVKVDEADFQLASTIMMAVLVILGKAICFACAGYTRPREEEETVRSSRTLTDPLIPNPTILTSNIVGVSNAERAKDRGKPDVVKDASAPARPKIPGISKIKMEGLEKARAERERIVQRFWDECVVPAPGNAIQASELHGYFIRWAESVGEFGLGPNPFGRALTKMQVKKREGAVSNSYLDIAIKPRGNALNGYAGSNVTPLPLSDKRHFG